MARKETAFNGELGYQDLAEQGKRIANASDSDAIKKHLSKMKSDNVIEIQRSAAIISKASDINIHLFYPHVNDFIEVLQSNSHYSASRIAFRILERIDIIEEKLLGPLMDISFKYLNTASTSIAEKVFAMTVIANQIDQFPDLKRELEASLSSQFATGSAGFQNRAAKIAKKYSMNL